MRRTMLVLLYLGFTVSALQAQQLTILDRSLKDVEAFAREDTNDSQRQYILALAHWKQHHWRQTDSLLRLAVQLDPRYADAYLALYFLPFARRPSLGDEEIDGRVPDSWKPALTEAEGFYQRAIRTMPMVNLQILGVAFEIDDPSVADMSNAEWLAYQRSYAWYVDLGLGRYRLAYDRMQKLVEREFDGVHHPEKIPDYILWYRGLAAAHSWQYNAAMGDFRMLLDRAIKRQQRDEIVHVPLRDNEYRFVLASLQELTRHRDSAIALYQEALVHDLGLVMAHIHLANLYEENGQAADALTERRRAAEAGSDDPTVLFDLAASLFNDGQVTQAEDPLLKAVKIDPRYAPTYYLLGRSAEELGLTDEARDQYTKYLALAPLRAADLRTDAQQRLQKLTR
ncbi:MAG TPA: tetratricopeptide repeat protein [Gemmatimonadales bacterium]|nr:tetratricopeptide repeat protein [Gemmatimonadales bacterium]